MSSAFILMHAYHSMQHKIVAHCQSVHLLENQLLTCLYQSQNIRLYHYYTVLCWQYKRNNICRGHPDIMSAVFLSLFPQVEQISTRRVFVVVPEFIWSCQIVMASWVDIDVNDLKKRLLHYLAISFTSPLPHVWQDEIGLKTSLGHLRYFTLVYNSFLPH